jgi:hypothetical protein
MKRWRPTRARAWTPILFFLFFLLPLLWGWSPTTYARAAGHFTTVSGSMTLATTNGTTFQFNDWPGPRFHLVLTLSAPWSGPNTLFTAQIQADNGQQLTAYFVGPAADGVTYTADATGG